VSEPDDEVDDERDEKIWTRGYRTALVGVIQSAMNNLGYQDTEATRAKWVMEREQTVNALRDACRDLGDNDWPDGLHLSDVVEKHLHRHFDMGRIVETIHRLLAALPSDEHRYEALLACCAACGKLDPECPCTDQEEE
jgi:hypothetical protein